MTVLESSEKQCYSEKPVISQGTALSGADKHFQDRSVELQIPPLRYASVGMTKGG